MKDILNIERVQRHATKYILDDYISDYKTRLIKLFPLMYFLEFQDIMFTIKSLKFPTIGICTKKQLIIIIINNQVQNKIKIAVKILSRKGRIQV